VVKRTRETIVLLIFSALVVYSPADASEERLELALIIGNNIRTGGHPSLLHYADDDAIEAALHFQTLHPRGRVWLLVNPDEETRAQKSVNRVPEWHPPTLDNFFAALNEIRDAITGAHLAGIDEVTLMVHFSGHGERDAGVHFEDGLLSAAAFRRSLDLLDADRVFVLLDGCYLGGLARGDEPSSIGSKTSIFRDIELSAEKLPRRVGIIGATSVVQEEDYLARGVMTTVELTALSGPADFNDDARISFRELGRYMAEQLGSVPDGPQLVVVPPKGFRRSIVVDLERSGLGGLRFNRRFPSGQIRVRRLEDLELVAEFYHVGTRSLSLRLPPGRYEIMRLLPRESWNHPGYPAVVYQVSVDDTMVSLDDRLSGQAVALLSAGERGADAIPPSVQARIMSAADERALLNSPFRRNPLAYLYKPTATWSLRVDDPGLGLDLARNSLDIPRARRWALALMHRRMWVLAHRRSQALRVGVQGQYKIQQQADVWSGQDAYSDVLRHELRMGPSCGLDSLLGRQKLAVVVSGGYAPSFLTSGLTELLNQENDRFVFSRNTYFDADISWTIPLGSHWDIGPILGGEVLRVVLPGENITQRGWEVQVNVGLLGRRHR